MRIAVVTTSYPQFFGDPSGHFVEAEVHALTQRGDAVHVVHPRGATPFGWPGVAANLRGQPWLAGHAAAWGARAIAELAKHAPFDRIVAHWAVPCAALVVWGQRAARAQNAELEVVSHGGDVRLLVALPQPMRAYAVKRIAARACVWRFVSTALLAQLTGTLPREVARAVDARALVGPCAIAMPDVRARIEAKRRALGDTKIAVTVARLVPSKRIDAAIADAALRGRELVVVGDGPERARLEATAARTTGSRVRFVGCVPREEALAWIGAADEVIHASSAEGASTVLREAEALGIPIRLVDPR